jgi:hypothetical protein
LFEKTPMFQALTAEIPQCAQDSFPNQLTLFDL